MQLLWTRLSGQTGHDAAYALLAKAVDPMPQIVKTERGKPYFAHGSLHFSISHTQCHAFCCIHTNNVGIDAEEADRDIDLKLADALLSSPEKRRFEDATDKRDALLRLFVLKESYAKLTGRGWGKYLQQTDFDPQDHRIQIIDGCLVAILTDE